MPSLSEAIVKLPLQSAITLNARSRILSSTLRLLGPRSRFVMFPVALVIDSSSLCQSFSIYGHLRSDLAGLLGSSPPMIQTGSPILWPSQLWRGDATLYVEN